MTTQIWQSFSCNNSSSARLIARFADAASAELASDDLNLVFASYTLGREVHERSDALQALATEYGFTWEDEGYGGRDDGPDLVVEGNVMIVYHSYCTGLGPGIVAYLEARGARVDPEVSADVQMSVMFRSIPGEKPSLDDELDVMFAQLATGNDNKVEPLRTPWKSELFAYGVAAFFRDAGTVGLCFPIEPVDIPAVKAWLATHDIADPIIRIEERADRTMFAAIATARCTACTGALEYLDPQLHDIETRQLVCRPCGGLYELDAFMERS